MKISTKSVSVKKNSLGRGVFAAKVFEDQDVVGEVTGKVIDDPNYPGSTYAIDLGEGVSLEPATPFRFLNHSCEPNSALYLYLTDEEQAAGKPMRAWLQAIRKIEVGEEMTIDYAWTADSAIPCKCGSSQCRGWIVDAQQLPDVVRYVAAQKKAKKKKQSKPKSRRKTAK